MKVVLYGGGGGVGSSIAHNLLIAPESYDVVLVDARRATAESHAMDLEEVLVLGGTGTVRVGDESEVLDADILVITAGAPLVVNSSRLVYLDQHAAMVTHVADLLGGVGTQWPGVALMVTNPVDPLVMAFVRATGLPRERVIGYTINDSLRLRAGAAQLLGVAPRTVEAWVIGEHGEACVPLLDRVTVDGRPVTLDAAQRAAVVDFLLGWYPRNVALDPTRTSTWTSGRGVAMLVGAVAGREQATIASVVLDGEYGVHGVALGVPVTVGAGGLREIQAWDLSPDERDGIARAADVVREAAAMIGAVSA